MRDQVNWSIFLYTLVTAISCITFPVLCIKCMTGRQVCHCGDDCRTDGDPKMVDRIYAKTCPKAAEFKQNLGFIETTCPNNDNICLFHTNLRIARNYLEGTVVYRLISGSCVSSKQVNPWIPKGSNPWQITSNLELFDWNQKSHVCSPVKRVETPQYSGGEVSHTAVHIYCACKTDLCNTDLVKMGAVTAPTTPATLPPTTTARQGPPVVQPPGATTPATTTVAPITFPIFIIDDMELIEELEKDKTRTTLDLRYVGEEEQPTAASTTQNIEVHCGQFPDSQACQDRKPSANSSADVHFANAFCRVGMLSILISGGFV